MVYQCFVKYSTLFLSLQVSMSSAHECSICKNLMSTVFYASLNMHNTSQSRQFLCNVQTLLICAHFHGQFITFGCDCSSILVSFSNYYFCTPSFSQVFISCAWLSLFLVHLNKCYFHAILILACVTFNFIRILHVFFSLSFWCCKCHLLAWKAFHIKKSGLGLFQGVKLVLMSHSYHVDMYHIDSQSF